MNEIVGNSNVYGVLVPGHDGRAGCAAIESTSELNLETLATHVLKSLPKYAVPLFIRMVEKLEIKETNKLIKTKLRAEGIDPSVVKDKIYWLQNGVYKDFTIKDWRDLTGWKVKL